MLCMADLDKYFEQVWKIDKSHTKKTLDFYL